jgi:hypothetical protein
MDKLRRIAPLQTLPLLAVLDVLVARGRRLAEDGDRGDVSITTVIIWVAVITLAVAIAAVITGALLKKYTTLLGNQ